MTIPIPIPVEYDDTDTDTDINAGRDAKHSANFRRWKLSDVLLSRKPLGPARLVSYPANKRFFGGFFVKIVHRMDHNV